MHTRAVVTGATSFVGQYLLAELAKNDVEVYAIVRPGSAKRKDLQETADIHFVLADMSAPGDWLPQIGHADWFFHLGWDGVGSQGRADESIQESNVHVSIRCLETAAKLGCSRFIFTGSQAEYGPCDGVISETTSCHPVTPYGRSKLRTGQLLSEMAEQLAMTFYHARIFSVYGPGDHPWTLVSGCIRTFCAGQKMSLSSGMQFWNYLHAEDAACLLYKLMQSNAPSGIYNIAGNDTRILREFVEEIRKACGGGTAEYGKYAPREKPGNLRPGTSKLIKQIGEMEFRPFGTAIKEMADKYRKMRDES